MSEILPELRWKDENQNRSHEDRTGVGAVITTRTDALLIGQG